MTTNSPANRRSVRPPPTSNRRVPYGRTTGDPRRGLRPMKPPARPPLPRKLPKAAWPWALALGAVGGAAAYYIPRAMAQNPAAPGTITGMDLATNTAPDYVFDPQQYRTTLTPRTIGHPATSWTMVYNRFIEWFNGPPRAYWGQTALVPPRALPRAPYPLEVPFPTPQASPRSRPRPRRVPRQRMRPRFRIRPGTQYPRAIEFGPNGITRARPNGRPPRGTRERKTRSRAMMAAMDVFWNGFNFLTELGDFMEVLLNGFGIESRGYKRDIETLLDIFENPQNAPPFDQELFIDGLIMNELEDQLVGRLSGKLTESLRNLGFSVYGSISPGEGII